MWCCQWGKRESSLKNHKSYNIPPKIMKISDANAIFLEIFSSEFIEKLFYVSEYMNICNFKDVSLTN